MKKIKVVTSVLCAALLGFSAFSLTSCGNGGGGADATTVMNVSLNPEVEFVLDANNKVVSVNARNEDGNLVISASAFENIEGKTAEEAAKLFVSVSKESGYLIEGSAFASDNEISFSISGDTAKAQELYNSVKSSVESKFTELNLTASVEEFKALAQTELQAMVAECAPYLEAAEVQAMSYAELVKELAESRKETAGIYSEQLKKAYYEAKEHALQAAELEVLKDKVGGLAAAGIEMAKSAYDSAATALQNARKTILVDADGVYQTAVKAFQDAKANYIEYKKQVAATLEGTTLSQAVIDELARLDGLVDAAEDTLEGLADTIDGMLAAQQTALDSAYDSIVTLIGDFANKVQANLTEISNKQKTAVEQVSTQFETDYAAAKAAAKTALDSMRVKVTAEPQA